MEEEKEIKMPGNTIILGAKGRLGRAAVGAFLAAGWHVRAFARRWADTSVQADAELIAGDAFDQTYSPPPPRAAMSSSTP